MQGNINAHSRERDKETGQEYRRKLLRWCMELAAAILIALAAELVFNLPSLQQGYEAVDLAGNVREEKGKVIYSRSFEQPVYVKKLILQGKFYERFDYNINLTVVNEFESQAVETITDRAYPELQYAFTNIGKKVDSIEVVFSKPEAFTLEGITCSNRAHANKYRMFLMALTVYLILLLVLEKKIIAKKPEWFYLVFALGFGTLIAAASGPCIITWDEEVHFRTVYSMNFSDEISWNQAALGNSGRGMPSVNTGEELVLMRRYMNAKAEEAGEISPGAGILRKEYLEYFPMILFFHVGRFLDLPFSVRFALGRMGNLLICVFLNYLAIRLAKRKKILIACIGMMPTVLFQESMYTYDGLIFSAMTLGTVLCMNEAEKEKRGKRERAVSVIVIGALWGIGCLAKPVYFPVFLIFLCLLRFRENTVEILKKRQYKIAGTIIAGIVCVLFLLYLCSPSISGFLAGYTGYGGDTRGGDTGIIGQFLSIISHPVAFCKMMVHELFTMDNFRNFGNKAKNHFMVTNLMFLNMYVLGILKDAWSLILIPLLMMLFLAEPEGELPLPGRSRMQRFRYIHGMAVICSVLLIWVAMYLAFTPIGSSNVEGVQARYFLPLLLPFSYVVLNDKIQLKIKKESYCCLTLGASLLLSAVCFYQTLIAGRVM